MDQKFYKHRQEKTVKKKDEYMENSYNKTS